MTWYQRRVLPVLTHLAMRNEVLAAERARWVPRASGTVLEIGAGSGLNVPFYGRQVRVVYELEPSDGLRQMAAASAKRAAFPRALIGGDAERLPIPNASVDTVVTTWTLCSIPDAARALGEARRVLRPDGRLVFVEHGRSPDPSILRWQDRLTPAWRAIAGGCHLNRPIDRLIAEAGFAIDTLERGYIRGPKVFAYLYRGVATPRPPRTGD